MTIYCIASGILLVALSIWLLPRKTCVPFPDWSTSAYTLPYPVGTRYGVSQASCTNGGHQGPYKYAYDFVMPIGTIVSAARAGVVTETRVKFRDGQRAEGEANWVKIRHEDDTIATYSHLTENGALVRAGNHVEAGQPVGLSGNTGKTGGLPHLHFHLAPCSEPADCGTLPVTFRNTEANPSGLAPHRQYLALKFEKIAK